MPSTANTSGTGEGAVVPDEIKGWSWGAFGWTWIWGLGNSTYLALIAIVPGLGFIMQIVLGIKGNEWAWKNKKWDSVEHFKKVQRTWARVFFIAIGIPLFILLSVAVLAGLNMLRTHS